MIVAIVLAYLVTAATAVPVTPGIAPPKIKSRADLPIKNSPLQEASSVKPGTHIVVQIHPSVQDPQPLVPQHQGSQGAGQFLMPYQPHPWGLPLLMPFQPHSPGAARPAPQPAVQPGPQTQLPQMFPSYGYFHMFPTPHGNQMFPQYGMPVFYPQTVVPQFPAPTGPVAPGVTPAKPEPQAQALQFLPYGMPVYYPQTAVPQLAAPTGPVAPTGTPAKPQPPAQALQFSPYGMPVFYPQTVVPQFPAPTGPVAPAVTPAKPEPPAPAPAPVPEEEQQQPQNPQIIWFQQAMNSALAGLSSEELELAGRIAQIGMYQPNVGAKAPKAPVRPASSTADNFNLGPVLPAFRLTSSMLIPSMGVSHGSLPTGQATQPGLTTMEVPHPGPQPGVRDFAVGLEEATVPVEPVATQPLIGDSVVETTPPADMAMETYTEYYP